MNRHLLISGLEHIEAEPDWERLKSVLLRRHVPERVPAMELIQDDEVLAAIWGRPPASFDELAELQLRLGYDTIQLRVSPLFKRGEVATADTAALSRGERTWAQAQSGLIKTREDFVRYPWPGVNPEMVPTLEQAERALPEGMGIMLRTSGILDNVMRLMGYERVCEATYEDPDLLQDVADRVGNLLLETFRQGLEFGSVIGVFFGDDMGFKTATMLSPDHLRTYILPWHKRIADLAHGCGKMVILHSCGCIDAVIEDLIEYVRIDALHSFQDAVTPVTSVKKRYGGRIGLVGGIDMDILSRATPEEVAAYTRKVLETCAPGGGYAVGSGNSIANYVPIDNYFAMLREGWNFRLG